MRLGLLIYGDLDTLTGGYVYDRKLVEHLKSRGDAVELVCLPWRSYPAHLADNLSAALLDRLRGLRLDLLLQDELNHPSLFWLNRRLRPSIRFPIVSIVHHLRSCEQRPAWQNRLYGMVERLYLRQVDACVYNSQTTRRAVVGLLGEEAPGVVAYPGGDRLRPQLTPAEISARSRGPGPLRLLFLGSLIPRKGLHVLVQALARLASAPWELAVVGRTDADPAYARRVHRQVRLAGLEKRIYFTGPLPDPVLAAQFIRSHLLVVPSSYEGFGIVYLEGMGFGLPGIATTSGAAAELIRPGHNGELVPPNDPDALARCLETFIGDRRRLEAYSLEARHAYLEHPTWDDSMASIRSFLLTLL